MMIENLNILQQIRDTLANTIETSVVIRVDAKRISRGRLRSVSDIHNNKFELTIQDFDNRYVLEFIIDASTNNSEPQNNMLDNNLAIRNGEITISWLNDEHRRVIVNISPYNVTKIVVAGDDDSIFGSFYNMEAALFRTIAGNLEEFDYVE